VKQGSNQSEKNKVARAFISRLPKESAAKNIKYSRKGGKPKKKKGKC